MDRHSPAHLYVGSAVALGALIAGSAAQARTDVHVSVGVPVAPAYVHPAPAYVHPAPVYVQPRPVYVQPAPAYVRPAPVYVQPAPVYVHPRPVYVQPRPVYVQPAPVYVRPPRHHGHGHGYGPWDGGGWFAQQRHAHRWGPHGDLDRDGIRNHEDRDRDGDGVRNRHDRLPNDRFRY